MSPNARHPCPRSIQPPPGGGGVPTGAARSRKGSARAGARAIGKILPQGAIERVAFFAVRSTATGSAAQFTVNFGVGGGEAMVVSAQGGPKLAA
jgi:hypothetical protein